MYKGTAGEVQCTWYIGWNIFEWVDRRGWNDTKNTCFPSSLVLFHFVLKRVYLGNIVNPTPPPTISSKRWATVESLCAPASRLSPPSSTPNLHPPSALHSYWSYISAPSTTITTTTGGDLKYYPFQQWPKNLKKKNSNMTKHWIELGGGYFVLPVELVSPHRRSCPP